MKTMISLPAGVAVFAFLALAGLMGLFAFNAALPAEAQAKPMEINYPENATRAVTTLSARSDDGRAITSWSLDGEDAEHFDIDAGRLSFNDPPDFENPVDADPDATPSTSDNVYEVTVQSTDEDGNVGERMVEVTVTNVDEPGKITLSGRQPQVAVTLTATLEDEDGTHTSLTWQWSKSRTINGNYSDIAGETGATYTPKDGDASYFLQAMASYTDPHGPGKSESVMSEYAVREAPSGTNSPPAFTDEDAATGVQANRKVDENTPKGMAFDKPVAAEEPNPVDRGKLTYSLGGTNADLFDINPKTGQLMTKGELDHEDTTLAGTATVLVMATDPTDEPVELDDAAACDSPVNHCAVVTVTIAINDLNEAPDVTGGTGSETAKVLYAKEDDASELRTFTDKGLTAASVAYVSNDEDDGDAAGAIELAGPDKDKFDITTTAGVLAFAEAPDFEDPGDADKNNVYEVTLRSTSTATDATRALTGTFDVRVMVVNGNDAGEIEFSRPVLRVAVPVTAELKDKDGVTSISSWRWYRGDITGALDTSGDPTDTAVLPIGTSATYEPVHADTTDPGLLTVVAKYTDRANGTVVQIASVATTTPRAVMPYSPGNEPPKFKDELTDTDKVDAKREIEENAAEGTPVGKRVEATDDKPSGDTVFIYTLEGPDKDKFKVTEDDTSTAGTDEGGQIQVGKDANLDYEAQPNTYTVIVRAEDSYGASNTIEVTIMVTDDPNEAPTIGPVSTDATLSDLTLSDGTLTPAFMTDTMAYTAMVEHSVDSVTVTATASHAGATVSGDGMHNLTVGENTITVMVTAEDGTTMMEYTITVTRAESPLPAVVVKYDDPANGGNDNGMVEVREILNAINDYKASRNDTTIAEVLELIRIYKSQT